MSTIAIARGTSPSLGRAITIAILSQCPQTPLEASDPGETRVDVVAVEYASKESITGELHGAHTLLSVILTKDAMQSKTLTPPWDMMKGLWLELKFMNARNNEKDEVGNVDELCPHIKSVSIREYTTQAWAA